MLPMNRLFVPFNAFKARTLCKYNLIFIRILRRANPQRTICLWFIRKTGKYAEENAKDENWRISAGDKAIDAIFGLIRFACNCHGKCDWLKLNLFPLQQNQIIPLQSVRFLFWHLLPPHKSYSYRVVFLKGNRVFMRFYVCDILTENKMESWYFHSRSVFYGFTRESARNGKDVCKILRICEYENGSRCESDQTEWRRAPPMTHIQYLWFSQIRRSSFATDR